MYYLNLIFLTINMYSTACHTLINTDKYSFNQAVELLYSLTVCSWSEASIKRGKGTACESKPESSTNHFICRPRNNNNKKQNSLRAVKHQFVSTLE